MAAISKGSGHRGANTGYLFSSAVSRRAFLSGAAAIAVSRPMHVPALSSMLAPAFLHVATSATEEVHTYALSGNRCELLGSTAIAACAACASHPALPVLYVARDCRQWEHLPRGVVETYAVECSSRPLRLLAQTPMSLSATGPRSLAVSNCGRHLLVAASTGGAWNAFALGSDGLPASVAIARKETGARHPSRATVLPKPHALAFSPRGSYAIGTDSGCERMALLQPSAEGIAIFSRSDTPAGLARSSPVWTSDGRYVIAANPQAASLSTYAVTAPSDNESAIEIHVADTVGTATPIEALLAHPTTSGVFTSRREGQGSWLELWSIHGGRLSVERDTWIPHNLLAIAEHAGTLWLASEDRIIQIRRDDLSVVESWKTPQTIPGVQVVITRS